MFRKIVRGASAALVIVGLSSCSGANPAPTPTGSTKSEQAADHIDITAVSVAALCTRLDYIGSRDNPSSATLTCQDGDEITIPGPFPVGKSVGEKVALPDGGTKPGKDGILDITSKQGKHHVWYYIVAEGGELRVWYDDELVQHSATGETTITKVVMRNFQKSDVTTSIAWK